MHVRGPYSEVYGSQLTSQIPNIFREHFSDNSDDIDVCDDTVSNLTGIIIRSPPILYAIYLRGGYSWSWKRGQQFKVAECKTHGSGLGFQPAW